MTSQSPFLAPFSAALRIGLLASLALGPSPAAAQDARVPAATAAPGPTSVDDSHVRAVAVPGVEAQAPPVKAAAPSPLTARPGPVSLNFSSVDVAAFAKAVLGDLLGLPYAVDPSVHGAVTVVTGRPIARVDVLPMVEDALKTSGLALEPRGGVYTITPLSEAKTRGGVIGADQQGFGNETVTLQYANPVELRKVLDPIVPGVIASADAGARTLVLTGATGQRRAVRELAEQFDMDWLKGMSFELFIPRNTDARLIAPELDKLINAPGSTVAGLVRLVAMERLNGIVAIATRAQYLEDVRRWVEVLDREGQSTERRFYIYRVQNGRAADIANVITTALGGAPQAPGGNAFNNGQKRGGFGAGTGGAGMATGTGGSQSFGAPGGATGGSTPSLASGLQALTTSGSGQTLPGQSPAAVAKTGIGGGSSDAMVVTADETNNAVVAYATPREFAIVEDALRKLDITPLQVAIEAVITEVTLNATLQYGSQWFFQAHGAQYGLTQSLTSQTPTQVLPGFNYTLLNGAGGVAATLSALSSVTHVNVLSAPNLMVLNNQTASLEVGDEVPVSTGSAISTQTAGAPVVNSVDYRDVGVILQVTPRVNSSGMVLLDIAQEVSQVDTTSATSSANPIASPVISQRRISSSIAVKDGQTIAMGGLIKDNDSQGRAGVPLFSAIPILGALVGNRDNQRLRTELLVLLTPRVIRDSDDAQTVTDELKQKIRSIEPLRPKFVP